MIKKQFFKSKQTCKATFTVPAVEADQVVVLGEFNNWTPETTFELKKQKDGSFKGTIELETGKEFQFRYLVDGANWMNDDEADNYVPNTYGGQNSVISTLN